MKSLICMLVFMFPVLVSAGELTITATTGGMAGDLNVFEVDTPASWLMVPENNNWRVDSDGKKLYFASPKEGEYTVIASVKDESEPSGIKILSTVFQNGGEEDEDFTPDDEFTAKIKESKKQVIGGTDSESETLAKAFDKVIGFIDDGTVKTVSSARMALKNTWIETANKNTIVKWNPFFTRMDAMIEDKDIVILREQFSKIARGIRND